MDPQTQFAICYTVITVFCLIFSVMMYLRTTADIGSEREIQYFRGLVVSFIAFCASDSIWALGDFSLIPIPDVLMYALSAISTAALAFACFFWYCHGESKLGGRALDKTWKMGIAVFPLAIMLALYASTYWTHLMFYYIPATTGRMQTGPLYAASIGLMSVYIFAVSIHSTVRATREKSPSLRREFLSYVVFAATPIAAGIFDAFVPNMPVIAPALFTSVFFVFLTLQESQIYNDALTGLNNRRRTNDYLAQAIAEASEEEPLTLFMIDLNFFKNINDTQGHIEGDHALRTVAEGIRKTCIDTRSFAARWGGDEFMVIAEKNQIANPAQFAQNLKDAIAEECVRENIAYDLQVSVGYAQCSSPTTRPAQLLAASDAALYEQKQLAHARANAERGVA